MVALKRSDIRVLNEALGMQSGYVMDFSNRTMANFFEEEFGIDIYDERYAINGTSKANRLRTFFEIENAFNFCRVARGLWKHWEGIARSSTSWKTPNDQVNLVKDASEKQALFELIARVESAGAVPSTDALYQFKQDETLEELISAIERDIAANKPAAALDRLHTYCQKKFAHLLEERGLACGKNEPLHSRVGKYVKALKQEREIRDITERVLKSSISILEKFNDIRNNESLAHDNELVDQAEARFIYDAVTAMLRFVKTVDAGRFGS